MSSAFAGIDYSVLAGPKGNQLDTTFAEIIDPNEVILQDVYKALTTPPGRVNPPVGMFWSNECIDLRNYLLKSYSQAQKQSLRDNCLRVFYNEIRYDIDITIDFQGFGIQNMKVSAEVYPSTNTTPILITFMVGTNQIEIYRQS